MPYSRGSEAMTKWILEAIARFHGWTVVYPEEYGFQDPFQLTIDDFVTEFHAKVQLAPYIMKHEVYKTADAKAKTVDVKTELHTAAAQTPHETHAVPHQETHVVQHEVKTEPAVITMTVPAIPASEHQPAAAA
jgi:hypothetical protein